MKIFVSMLVIIPVLLSNFSVASEYSPGWCKKNLNATERVICNKTELIRYDNKLNSLFLNLRKNSSEEEFSITKNDQSTWLNGRNKCKDDFFCIQQSYINRTDVLQKNVLQKAIVNRDIDQLILMTNNNGMKISCSSWITDSCEFQINIQTSDDLNYFFEKIFPRNIINKLNDGQEFELNLRPMHIYPFYEIRTYSLDNYSFHFTEYEQFIFDTYPPIAHFEKAGREYTEIEKFILSKPSLITKANQIEATTELIKSYGIDNSLFAKIQKNFSTSLKKCINSSSINDCFDASLNLASNALEEHITKQQEIKYDISQKDLLINRPKKFIMGDRRYQTFQEPGTTEPTVIKIDLTKLKYIGSVLPSFEKIWVGSMNHTVQTVKSYVHIYQLDEIITDINGEGYNSIIIDKSNDIYLAGVSISPDPYDADLDEFNNSLKTNQLDKNKIYIFSTARLNEY